MFSSYSPARWLLSSSLLFVMPALGAVTFSQKIVYTGFTADNGFSFDSEPAFMLGDTFTFHATFDETLFETRAGSNFWLNALSSFSLVKDGGSGSWSPIGTFPNSGIVSLFGSSGLSTYGVSSDQPNLTNSPAIFRNVSVELAAGTIFRDITSPDRLTLGTRLGGPILPDNDNSRVSFDFYFEGSESSGRANFKLIPEPSGLLLASCFILLSFRRKRGID